MFNKFIQRPVLSIVISLIVVLGVLSVMNLPLTHFLPFQPMVNVTDYPDEELIGYNFIPTCKKPMV
jgi:HAE1 family hydrophobic/amphiphilic exporter-1